MTLNTSHTLAHHFLVATPALDGTYFERSVIYLVEDGEEGSMGLVINQPTQTTVRETLENLDIPILHPDPRLDDPILAGGPVEEDHGFVLHRPAGAWSNSMVLEDDLALTASVGLLKRMGQGQYPQQMLMFLGYAGWSPGQLQQELARNSWLVIPYSRTLLFDIPYESRWEAALHHLGITLPGMLSAEYGHA